MFFVILSKIDIAVSIKVCPKFLNFYGLSAYRLTFESRARAESKGQSGEKESGEEAPRKPNSTQRHAENM